MFDDNRIHVSEIMIGDDRALDIDGFKVVKFVNQKYLDINIVDKIIDIKVFDKNNKRVGFARLFIITDFSGRGRNSHTVHIMESHPVFEKIAF